MPTDTENQIMQDMMEAFVSECQASLTYKAYARQAEDEDMPQIARLFRAAAHAESIHALNHLRVLDRVQSTKENLRKAIETEDYENNEMYPRFIENAEKAHDSRAVSSYRMAMEVEGCHRGLCSRALRAAMHGRDLECERIYVCKNCGNTACGDPPEICPVCSVPQAWYSEVH